MLTSIDLFSGCGGLSLGLDRAGFSSRLAVEKSPMAAETYYHNFIGRLGEGDWDQYLEEHPDAASQAEAGLVVKELGQLLESKETLAELKAEDIDLVAGGPPCQGFSLAGRRDPDDIRNQLPWQFLEFVEAVDPKSVVIENVSGMTQNFNKYGRKSPFMELKDALSTIGRGYVVQPLHLNAMHYGVPQHRPRVMLVGIRTDIAKAAGIEANDKIWRSEYDFVTNIAFPQRPDLAPEPTHFGENILTVADAISDLSNKGYRRLSNLPQYADNMRSETVPVQVKSIGLSNHTLRKHAPHIEDRFRLYQYLREQGIPSRIMSIPKDGDLTHDGKRLKLKQTLPNVSFPAFGGDKKLIANNLTELIDAIMPLGTKKHSQRALNWSLPSPTVVSLPDDYVHPERPRTLTVREMARFQSFPDSFVFRSKETTGSHRRKFEVPQYTQVGNAVPPRLGEAIGKLVHSVLLQAKQLERKTG